MSGPSHSLGRPFRVVLVDDDVASLSLWRQVLDMHGYEVLTFEQPAKALTAIEAGCDCVITDYSMPGMSGADLVRAAARPGGPAFIVLTGHTSQEVAQDALQAGASCVITKPAKLNAVTSAVEWLCARRAGIAAPVPAEFAAKAS